MRKRWLAVGAFAVFGCHTIVAPVDESSAPLRVAATQPLSPDDADHLALAAECVERGDQRTAAAHLESYVRTHPDQLLFRAHLADLLLKTEQHERAKFHFERFIADAQTATGPAKAHLIHCHTRLMEIGTHTDDRHGELFHRGIGLMLLAKDPEADAEFREEMLCKAIKALLEAKELKPTDARVHVYLAEAQELAGHRRAAEAARRAAQTLATPGTLTADESRRLTLR